jgi:hypothetical protein
MGGGAGRCPVGRGESCGSRIGGFPRRRFACLQFYSSMIWFRCKKRETGNARQLTPKARGCAHSQALLVGDVYSLYL